MKLSRVLEGLDYDKDYLKDVEVDGIEYDSRQVKNNCLFVALGGQVTDGHEFIPDALRRGAIAVVGEKDVELPDVPYVKVHDLKENLSVLANNFYGKISQQLMVAGVTGTNGKTTVTYFVESVLQASRIPALVIGTVNYRMGASVFQAINTTPSILDTLKLMKKAYNRGIKHCIIEVSSHSLVLGRVKTIDFNIAAFTNLTQDHLDFHNTMEEYAAAKKILFDMLSPGSNAIVNADDKYADGMVRNTAASLIKYGFSKEYDVYAEIKNMSISGSELEIFYEKVKYTVKINLVGLHNISNALCAFAICVAYDILPEHVIKGLASLKNVPGRLELVPVLLDFNVFVDYAHTPDALKKVITGLRPLTRRRIITVFGAGGDRDRGKRSIMGQIASENSDFVFITSDNPRTEEPASIIKDIAGGISKDNYEVIEDRAAAIRAAMKSAKTDDVILIAGKGHEQYQIIGHTKHHFNDIEEVKKVAKEL